VERKGWSDFLRSLAVPIAVGIVSGFASSYASFQVVSHQVIINTANLADHEERLRASEAAHAEARLEMEKVLGEIRARLAGIEARLGASKTKPEASVTPAPAPVVGRELGG